MLLTRVKEHVCALTCNVNKIAKVGNERDERCAKVGNERDKDVFGSYVRRHRGEIAIVGIMTAVLVGVAVSSLTGDIIQAFAKGRR